MLAILRPDLWSNSVSNVCKDAASAKLTFVVLAFHGLCTEFLLQGFQFLKCYFLQQIGREQDP